MKENKLTEAVGDIDARYIAEAESATATRRRPSRVLLIAALIAVAVCAVGFTAASRFYFAPGVGIVDDATLAPPQVWAAFDEITLGETKVDAVVMGEGAEGYNLTVWIWRGKAVEQDPLDSLMGIPPKELTNFSLFVDGVEYPSISSSLSTGGFSSYSYAELPYTETVTLQDSNGNTADVALSPISESQYAHLKGITWDDMALSLVPVSGTTNLFAGRLTDPRTAAIAEDAQSTTTYMSFLLTHADGSIGKASGDVDLTGVPAPHLRCIEVNNDAYGKPITAISPTWIMVGHNFNIHDCPDMPRVTITVPEIGAGYACNEVLYEKAGLTVRLTRVERDQNGLHYTTAIDTADGLAMSDLQAYVYHSYSLGKFDYTYNDGTSVHHDVWPRQVYTDHTTGEMTYSIGHNGNDDITYETVKPGDELVVILNSLRYQYLPEGVDFFDPDNTEVFGTIELN